ncbi:MAG: methyltransferase type 12, partial [Paenibacillaceae bacterium]|nr:methyltransferase type 12 [Paenibacillaceae bacterium]
MSYGKFALVYDRLMEDMPYGDWIAFALEAFSRKGLAEPGASGADAVRPVVADLGCGTGSIAIPLAAQGYRVYGIDLSEAMLSIAEDKSRELLSGPRGSVPGPVWLAQDMREWELDELADAAVSFCDCLNYLTEEEDVAAVFNRTFEGLKPGGVFLFDVHTEKTLLDYAENQPFVYNEEDLSYIWECGLDEELCLISHDLAFFVKEPQGGLYSRFDEAHEQRAYPLQQLNRLLAAAGFDDNRMFADF